MNRKLLANFKVEIKIEEINFSVRSVNLNGLSSTIDTTFSRIPKTERTKIINNILEQYKAQNTLVLYSRVGNDNLTDAIKELANLTEEDLDDKVGELTKGSAEENADELLNAIENAGSASNAGVKSIMNNLDTNSDKGLRYEIYKRIKDIGADGVLDLECFKYSRALAEATALYFATGIMHIAVHTGGSAIIAVGTATAFTTSQNISSGTSTIQSGAKTYSFREQIKRTAEGISNMITNGSITSIVIGTRWIESASVPYIANGTKSEIKHSPLKSIIETALFAAYAMLLAGSLTCLTTRSWTAWKKMLSNLNAKDGNDAFAAILAAGIKASIAGTITIMSESSAGSRGISMLIPFGP